MGIYAGMLTCIEEDKIEKAARMFAVAGLYGQFDERRVTDTSAHQAIPMLLMHLLEPVSEEKKNRFQEIVSAQLARGSSELKSLCQSIRKLGPPDYFPRYMIQHGLKAFLPEDGTDGLQKDFNAETAWHASLDAYLHCPEEPAQP